MTAARGMRVIAAASIGNALEFYDFIVYGFFATSIGAAFFPSHDEASRLLLTFATFGVSFLARPIGAAVLGGVADRHGRRITMMVAVGLMTVGCTALAVVPTAARIGIAAPLLVLAARVIQGFSLGGEYGASTAFLLEHEPARARFFAAFQPASQNIASTLASGVGWGLGFLLDAQAYGAGGFRIAFALGALIGPVGLLLRRQLDETDAFRAMARAEAPVRRVLLDMPGRLLVAGGTIAIGTGVTYVLVYLPTFASSVLHMHMHGVLAATVLSYVAATAITLTAARVFERAARLRWMTISTIAMMAAAWPLFALLRAHPDTSTFFWIRVAMFVLWAPYSALQPSMLASLFPAAYRVSGISIGYTMGVVTFGAFAPLANQWLVAATGNATAPGFFVIAMGGVTLCSLAWAAWTERQGAALDPLGRAAPVPAGFRGRAPDL